MNITYMSTVDSDRVVVCTRENTDWRMLQYSTSHGGKLKNTPLKEDTLRNNRHHAGKDIVCSVVVHVS